MKRKLMKRKSRVLTKVRIWAKKTAAAAAEVKAKEKRTKGKVSEVETKKAKAQSALKREVTKETVGKKFAVVTAKSLKAEAAIQTNELVKKRKLRDLKKIEKIKGWARKNAAVSKELSKKRAAQRAAIRAKRQAARKAA